MAPIRQIGRLRHRIELQQRTATLDTLGRQSRAAETWIHAAYLWAEVREMSGSERDLAKQIVADASISVTIRHRPGLTSTGHRLRFRGRTLEIKAVLDPDSTQRSLQLLCGEAR